MTVHYADDWLTVLHGDIRDELRTLPDESVHCVVTSPPYWGLRDYGTASWEGGDPACRHLVRENGAEHATRSGLDGGKGTTGHQQEGFKNHCPRCGAVRLDNQLGLEPTPEQYVENMVAVFREVRRVLRSDGTLWLNLGDSYNTSPPGNKPNTTALSSGLPNSIANQEMRRSAQAGIDKTKATGLKPKDLVGIPWRVAFALQADGWYLRSDIIWSKPNPMPESVTDRPTKSHEYLFLLTKSARYYFDADAVREANAPDYAEPRAIIRRTDAKTPDTVDESQRRRYSFNNAAGMDAGRYSGLGRNIRSVWTIATAPYPGAHFATFPPKLVEPCIKAGTSEKGVCHSCGAPWVRILDVSPLRERDDSTRDPDKRDARKGMAAVPEKGWETTRETKGWRPSCIHDVTSIERPATVLDPFAGSGTTGMVAQSLSRRAVLIDLNVDYLGQLMERNREIPLGLESA